MIMKFLYENLLTKLSFSATDVQRLRRLCIEIYKTVNNLNPIFMQDIFKLRKTTFIPREKYKNNLQVIRPNQETFGTKSLRCTGPKIWNSLPAHIKGADSLKTFKNLIKNWNGVSCICSTCNFLCNNI